MIETALPIALYGAGLATFTALRGVRRDRKTMVVACGAGYQEALEAGATAVPVITIAATNTGVRPIEVCGAGFVSADNGEHIERAAYRIDPSRPPVVLGDGATVHFHYRTSEDVSAAMRLDVEKVYVRTSAGGLWFGEPDEWLKPLQIDRRWWS